MELRVLRYFLAIAREENLSNAAKRLHITQPTLSRQMMELEEELGTKLFVRGRRSRRITLTESGIFLRTHAEEVILLMDKIESAFSVSGDTVSGDVYVATGETNATHLLAMASKSLQEEHPNIRYHIFSGDGREAESRLDKGLVDFALILGSVDTNKYDFIDIPTQDVWGVLMKRDAPLAKLNSIRAEDLWDKPLIFSRQVNEGDEFFQWLQKEPAELNVVAYYNQAYNSPLMTETGLGYTIILDKRFDASENSDLCFRPFEPPLVFDVHLAWKKYQMFSKAAKLFLNRLKEIIDENSGDAPAR